MEDTRRLEGHDLSGRLFHTLLTDAKFTGAYYTSVPAATLLSRLVFHDWPPHVDWADHEFPASLDVADLACGTGTLLMAVATEVERRHKNAGGTNAAALHKAMVEQALHGFDVQLSAVHFAATSLAMLNPEIRFDRMNLYVMPLGTEGSNVSWARWTSLGSDEAPVQFALSGDDVGVATRESKGCRAAARQRVRTDRNRQAAGAGPGPGDHEPAVHPLRGRQPAVRQPPRSRAAKTPERVVAPAEARRSTQAPGASVTAGLGAAFVAAASPKLRPGEGRLALVLPVTVCTGPSWDETRSFIERDFALDVVIASHDPARWNFSDSTDLSEALS